MGQQRQGNSLVAIDPRTGRQGRPVRVADPYNLYFTPDGQHALVMAERLHRIDVRSPRTMRLQRSLPDTCRGINHADDTADLSHLVVSCEFSGQLLVIDRAATGVEKVIDARSFTIRRFIHTGKSAHGIYPSRDATRMFVSNRDEGTVSVLDTTTLKPVARWRVPGGGSPDMGGVSADGKQLWLSGRYDSRVYVFDTTTGALVQSIGVKAGPHGLCVWPQPGSYSLGHTGNMR